MRPLMLVVGLASLVLLGAGCSADPSGPPSAALGTVASRLVPTAVAHMPLTDEHGATVDLASFRGKTVMLVPFLTLCTDICPLDTGDLLGCTRPAQ